MGHSSHHTGSTVASTPLLINQARSPAAVLAESNTFTLLAVERSEGSTDAVEPVPDR